MFTEMRLAALIHKPGAGPTAMRAQEALDMATLAGAKAMNWSADIGSIEVGKKADLIALDLSAPENAIPATAFRGKLPDSEAVASSIVYSSPPAHVRWTMVDGRVLYKNGKVSTISRPDLMKDVRKSQLEIARRVRNGIS